MSSSVESRAVSSPPPTPAGRVVLFLCTGNSVRSQMAEGLARRILGPGWEVHSAGLEPKGVHPLAVRVMDELGIDLRSQRSKTIDPEVLGRARWVITLCGDARERCPVPPPGTLHLHWDLPDPARVEGDEATRLAAFRQVRDELARRLEQWAEQVREG